MKKLLLSALTVISVTGCTTVKDYIPSFWDDNQSAAIINVLVSIDKLNCQLPHAPQVLPVRDQLKWFEFYSQAKGSKDVARLIEPMQKTVNDFYQRSVSDRPGSTAYCELKKRAMLMQGQAAAKAVLGRF